MNRDLVAAHMWFTLSDADGADQWRKTVEAKLSRSRTRKIAKARRGMARRAPIPVELALNPRLAREVARPTFGRSTRNCHLESIAMAKKTKSCSH